MNLVGYRRDKERGLVLVTKIGNAYAIAKRRFSEENGMETDPEVQGIRLEAIENQRKTLADAMSDYDALLADLRGL